MSIYPRDSKLETKVFFKPTDRNRYLPTTSGHDPLWIKNIPKGPIMRVKRNCSKESNFLTQSKILTERFEARGYKSHIMEKLVEEIRVIPRESCLQPKPVTKVAATNTEWGFV